MKEDNPRVLTAKMRSSCCELNGSRK